MKRFAIVTATAALTATTALAQVPFSAVDTDDDNMLSFEEVTAVYTDVSSEDFGEMDENGDDMIDPVEANTPVSNNILSQAEATTTGMNVDINAEGNQTMYYDFDEATARYPDLSSEDFQEIDQNGDDLIDATEIRTPEAAAILNQ
ncbi:hypothetical protein SAMN04490244_104286 [Tranquillimonas rosea]|uniref:EF-hand domain-containing protein n=1 Tax=Tranquillimonas rosea TaxID=641238 RepID=A0A1H9TNE2_9RHOB|nr:hypothetical protein [Tranquillimonas rosea]SER98675.1 hypothetical protein SAMN04490244_104286 [Tranquillimonas rosea]